MSEGTSEEMGEEQSGANIHEQREVQSPILEAVRPSSKGLVSYIPKPEIWNIAHPEGADFPHHGVLHGEETAILSAVLLNVAYEDVKARLGEERANAFRASLDEQALLYAAAYHDCGRITDWGLFSGKEEIDGKVYKGEMQIHGPRGAQIIRGRRDDVDPTLKDEQVERMVSLIDLNTGQDTKDILKDVLLGKLHISTQASAARVAHRERPFEEYDPEELMLRILQEADTLGKPRGYHSRRLESPRRVPLAAVASAIRTVRGKIPILRNRPEGTYENLRFPETKRLGLYQVAADLTQMSRRDPEIERQFAHVPHRSGAAMEAGEKLGILKP